MNEKQANEIVELLWGITEKLDKLIAAIEKLSAVKPESSGSQTSIDTGEL